MGTDPKDKRPQLALPEMMLHGGMRMTRKRAIKLIMAAGGNGQPHHAAKQLDSAKRLWNVDNCTAVLYVLKRQYLMYLTMARFLDMARIVRIYRRINPAFTYFE